ncbi:MAG: OmpA family protein [Pseudomonadota bacterium]
MRQGRYETDAKFLIYSNYAHFIDEMIIEVFAENDTDRRTPLDVFIIDTSDTKQLFYTQPWALAGKVAATGNSLVYRLTVSNADGLTDQTAEQRAFMLDAELYEAQVKEAERLNRKATSLSVRPLDDGVVVFVPGTEDTQAFEFRPHFAELGTDLSADDKATLDAIVADWQDATGISINVTGHTSSVGIAQRSRHIFADNYALSRARAQVVADYLAAGLNQRVERAEAAGVGPDEPIASNATADGRALNRRAEVQIEGQRVGRETRVHVVPRETESPPAAAEKEPANTVAQDTAEADETLIKLLNRNDLQQRRIPIYGSRIRVQGNDVGSDYRIWLNGEAVPVDNKGQFAAEYLLPIGQHTLGLRAADAQAVAVDRDFTIDVSGKYRFMVALADFTLSSQDVSGSVEPLSGDDRYAEDLLTEGRLAFYLKGKIRGKYLLTAQLDTREEEIEDLFSDIHKKDPDSLFRRLDPDRYYPVYGDDSTTVADVNTQGRMYVRLEWDRSEVLWGNYETGLTGNELTQYGRGLYGAKATYESLAATEFDDSRTLLSGFVSEAQTALGHSEFLGTGGSLYYLHHTDILPGSERLTIEVRDPDTNRVIDVIPLAREVDYEIDEIQGRVILNKPLLQVSSASAPSIIVDGPLDGNLNILIADYEYVPDNFDPDNLVVGARGKQWLSDHVGIGATYVDEGRDAEDYRLAGLDLTLKAAQDSWMKLEWAASEATQTARMFSTDGGLSFNNLSPITTQDRAGDAYNVDIHINAGDFGGSDRWITNAWYKEVDDHFSVARRDDGNNVWEYGIETHIPVSERWRLGVRASYLEVDEQYDLTEISAQVEGQVSERGTLAAEVKSTQENRVGADNAEAVLLGLQYEHNITSHIDLYASGQTTVSTDGNYQNNDQLAVGAKLKFSQSTSGQIEVRDGDRGDGLLAGLEHRLNERHSVYGTVTHSTDNTADPLARSDNGASMLDNVGTNFAAGHRWAFSDRANLFSEMQFSRNDDFSGLGEVFGLDYAAASGWHFGFTLQDGEITDQNGIIERQAFSVSTGYQSARLKFSSKIEIRDDQGVEDVEQWLTTNRLDYKLNDTYRFAAKLNFSESDNAQDQLQDAKLIEGSLGLARRPHDDDRFNWLSKYTYLHDLQSFGQQDAETDQRSHVISWEGIYRLNQRWDLGSKLARRMGELRLSRNAGPWFKSTVNFAAIRARLHILHNWDAMAEYRWLQQEQADNQRGGFLITVDRHIAQNFKIGLGYNFTNFSDDLTDLDYDHQGWFLNVVGKY